MKSCNAIYCSLLTAILFSLSLPPFDQWYLAYIAFVPLLYLTVRANYKEILQLYTMTAIVVATAWWYGIIAESLASFIQTSAVFTASFILWGLLTRYLYKNIYNGLLSFMLPVLLWVGIERILTSAYIGVPANPGLSQYSRVELIQTASFFGVYAISFILLLTNSLIACSFFLYRQQKKSLSFSSWPIMIAVLINLLNYHYGVARLTQDQGLGSISVAVIQPAISSELYQNSKRNSDDMNSIKNVLNELTDQAVKKNIDMLFRPQVSSGTINMRINSNRAHIYETARRNKVDMFISSDDIDSDGNKYNSVFSISNDGEYRGRYDKVHLTTGAEDGYSAGVGNLPVKSSYGNVGVALNNELSLPELYRASVSLGSEILFSTTNDSAFQRSVVAINHANTSVFRALENNRWMIHASNAGPSMIVSPYGVVTARSSMYHQGVLYGEIDKVASLSSYGQWGYMIPIVLSGIVVLLLIYIFIKEIIVFRNSAGFTWISVSGVKHCRVSAFDRLCKACRILLLTIITSLGFVLASFVAVNVSISDDKTITTVLRDFLRPPLMRKDTVAERSLQSRDNTCGPAALAYLLNTYGMEVREDDIVDKIYVTRLGSSLLELKKAAFIFGFQAKGYKGNFEWMKQQPLPLIAHINDKHYVVINKIVSNSVYMFDPLEGHVVVNNNDFERSWSGYALSVRTMAIN